MIIKVGEYYERYSDSLLIVIVTKIVNDRIHYQYISYHSNFDKYVRFSKEFKDIMKHLPGHSSPLWRVINE